jgi:hypothetical protein
MALAAFTRLLGGNARRLKMAVQDTFKVSSQGHDTVEVTWQKPESAEDERWAEMGVSAEAHNDLAIQSLVIKMQSGARGRLEDGPEAVQEFVDNYRFGARQAGGGTRKIKLAPETASALGFTEEQLAALAAAGVSIG